MSDAAETTDETVPSFDSARHFWGRFYDWITKRKGETLTEDDLKAGVQYARSSTGGAAKAAKSKQIIQAADALALCDMGMSLSPKLAKDESNYRTGSGDEVCGRCRFFQMGACSLVEGSIEATDTCDLWHAPVQAWLPVEPAAQAMYGDVVVGESDHGPALFADVELADVPTVIPILPKPGNYAHPVYGSFDVTPALIDTIIANFDARVRPQDVPINAEHVAKTAGALGYVRQVVRRDDGGLDGIPEFTDLGAELIKRDRFKYCSAEIDTYTDPLTTDDTPNVLFGVALTTRPFFKEAYLPRLAASDDGRVVAMSAKDGPPGDRQEEPGMSDKDSSLKLSDEQMAAIKADVAKEFTERIAAAEAREQAKADEAKQFAERVASLEDASQTKTFTDWTQGRGGKTDGARWYVTDKATTEAHVGFLKKLAKAFGEDSEEVAFYRDYAAQVGTVVKAASEGAFVSIGTDARVPEGGGDANAKIDAAAKAKLVSGEAKTYGEAVGMVEREQPKLFGERASQPTQTVRVRPE